MTQELSEFRRHNICAEGRQGAGRWEVIYQLITACLLKERKSVLQPQQKMAIWHPTFWVVQRVSQLIYSPQSQTQQQRWRRGQTKQPTDGTGEVKPTCEATLFSHSYPLTAPQCTSAQRRVPAGSCSLSPSISSFSHSASKYWNRIFHEVAKPLPIIFE